MATVGEWTPTSWKTKTVAQPVHYEGDNADKLPRVLNKLSSLPPLVTAAEVERLRHQLARVQEGKAFLLHAGDCAESFDSCTAGNIEKKVGLILSFSLVLVWGGRKPVVRVGRIAGQYAKPRSSPKEKVKTKGENGEEIVREVMSFRGDNVNGLDINDRQPDPDRLLSAYFHSTTTLNYIRGLLSSGYASLYGAHPRDWSLNHVRSDTLRNSFTEIIDSLSDALDFSQTIGATKGDGFESGAGRGGAFGEVDFYVSHEGLMLDYEEALTRKNDVLGKSDGYYNSSAHFIWIGDRTRQLDGAHVEYFRGIRNPIGIKVGPTMKGDELVRLVELVNPNKEPGRVTLITRYGADKVEAHLPGHIQTIQESGHPVVWVCDPMHGNTHTSATTGLKTRHFKSIITELTATLAVHAKLGTYLGGASLEFTGELNDDGYSVTECLGGSMELSEEELGLRYQSFCDPRLNFEQSLDLAFLLSNHFKHVRKTGDRSEAAFGGELYKALGGRIKE
ncbi:DAHP synthetase [Marasmius fiardii PR-910]|nr:DAHP synthetase [Marasmius fiardii PR-910]